MDSKFYESWPRRLAVTSKTTHKTFVILKRERNSKVFTLTSFCLCNMYDDSRCEDNQYMRVTEIVRQTHTHRDEIPNAQVQTKISLCSVKYAV